MAKSNEALRARVLSALGHTNRIRILEYLRNEIKCNCEIAPALKLEQSNLSRHLKILVQEGILISWKEGLRVNYKISDERIYEILKIAQDVALKSMKEKLQT